MVLLLATVIWGTTFVAQSVGMEHIGPFTFQTVRCMLAVLCLLLFIGFMDLRTHNKKVLAGIWKDKKLWKAGVLCGLALFGASSLQQIGLVYTDAGKAGFLTSMYIVLVPISGILLRKKPPRMAFTSVGLAVVGLYLLSCVGVTTVNIGDLYLIGCAFVFTVQITLVDHYAAELDSLRLNCIQCLVCALASLIGAFTESPSISAIANCWLPLCYAGILSMGVAYTLQIIGQKNLEPTAASLIMSMESVFAVLGGWLILKERMSGWEIAGCVLVFAAVILSQLPDKKKNI